MPQQRDDHRTRAGLARWCSTAIAGGAEVRIGPVSVPEASGFANETLVFEASWPTAGGTCRRRLVARIAPDEIRVYPDRRLADQYRALRVLGRETDVPVPEVLGHEPGTDLLGAPFLVMAWVPGRVPADLPSYHRQGWLAELPAADRAAVWHNGVDVLGRVHRLDPAALGLGFLKPREASAGLVEGALEQYASRLDFFGVRDSPEVSAALTWLRANRPRVAPAASLLWGDARLGNLLFDGVTVAAVLDWEMASLGPAEIDLAWFLHLDRFLSQGIGADRLPGLPGEPETLDRWSRRVGRPPRDLDYYLVFAAFRFALITSRVSDLMVRQGIIERAADVPLHRNAVRALARTLDEVVLSRRIRPAGEPFSGSVR
nr:putative phosphotransferase [Amycolatopsis sp.]